MQKITSDELISHFKMEKHPEGGYYKESFKSNGTLPQSALPSQIKGDRLWSSAIYFLLCNQEKSKLHKIAFDEVWHFYLGDPIVVVEIEPDGNVKETILGPDFIAGQKLQHVVPGGRWFGSYLPEGSQFAFVGCTVAPGFDFRDFEMGDKHTLLELYPDAKQIIEKLT